MSNVEGKFRNAVLDGILDKRFRSDHIQRAVDALDAEVRASGGASIPFLDRMMYHSLLYAVGKKLMGGADALDAMAAPLSKLDALYLDKIDHGWACELMVWPGSNSAEADAMRPLLNKSGIPTTL